MRFSAKNHKFKIERCTNMGDDKEKKDKKTDLLSKLEQEEISELQNSDYYEIHKEIKIFQTDLKEIEKKVFKSAQLARERFLARCR